jgi:hypothetical protein
MDIFKNQKKGKKAKVKKANEKTENKSRTIKNKVRIIEEKRKKNMQNRNEKRGNIYKLHVCVVVNEPFHAR